MSEQSECQEKTHHQHPHQQQHPHTMVGNNEISMETNDSAGSFTEYYSVNNSTHASPYNRLSSTQNIQLLNSSSAFSPAGSVSTPIEIAPPNNLLEPNTYNPFRMAPRHSPTHTVNANDIPAITVDRPNNSNSNLDNSCKFDVDYDELFNRYFKIQQNSMSGSSINPISGEEEYDIFKKIDYEKTTPIRLRYISELEDAYIQEQRQLAVNSIPAMPQRSAIEEEIDQIMRSGFDINTCSEELRSRVLTALSSNVITEEDFNLLRKVFLHYLPDDPFMSILPSLAQSNAINTNQGFDIVNSEGYSMQRNSVDSYSDLNNLHNVNVNVRRAEQYNVGQQQMDEAYFSEDIFNVFEYNYIIWLKQYYTQMGLITPVNNTVADLISQSQANNLPHLNSTNVSAAPMPALSNIYNNNLVPPVISSPPVLRPIPMNQNVNEQIVNPNMRNMPSLSHIGACSTSSNDRLTSLPPPPQNSLSGMNHPNFARNSVLYSSNSMYDDYESGSAMNSDALLNDDDRVNRRETHNMLERKRRKELRIYFEDLVATVPSLKSTPVNKCSKVKILNETTARIHEINSTIQNYFYEKFRQKKLCEEMLELLTESLRRDSLKVVGRRGKVSVASKN